MARKWARWVPAGVAALVVAGAGSLAGVAQAEELPDRSPAEVLQLLAEHEARPFSGEFEVTSDLGLLALPAELPSGASGDGASEALAALTWLTGDHEGRVFVGEGHLARLQLFDGFDERDVVVAEDATWLYDSSDDSAVRLPAPSGDRAPATALPAPAELADRALEAIDPSTSVSVEDDVVVAGRSAYGLVLTPRSSDTLVGAVTIAVDGQTGMPLRVSITARGAATPAIEAGYTSLDLGEPDPGVLTFTPSATTSVEEVDPGDLGDGHAPGRPADSPLPKVSGEGWGTIVELPAGTVDPADAGALLAVLTTDVDGGRALQTALATVLLTDDGRVLVGAVPLDRLQAAA